MMGVIRGRPTPIEVLKVPDPKYATLQGQDDTSDEPPDFHYLWRAYAPNGTYADGDSPEEAVDAVCS